MSSPPELPAAGRSLDLAGVTGVSVPLCLEIAVALAIVDAVREADGFLRLPAARGLEPR